MGFYMREYWIIMHTSPILYRYIDWSITVPLQMIEFNLILVAVKPDLGAGMFWRLLLGTVAMLSFGYGGETHSLGPFGAWLGFVLGLSGWGYILFEIFQDHALHCHSRLVYLSPRLLLRILDGQRGGLHS